MGDSPVYKMGNSSVYKCEKQHLKSCPGEGWEFCTNTRKDHQDSHLAWSRKRYGNGCEYKVVDEAYNCRGASMPDCSSIWRKKKEG